MIYCTQASLRSPGSCPNSALFYFETPFCDAKVFDWTDFQKTPSQTSEAPSWCSYHFVIIESSLWFSRMDSILMLMAEQGNLSRAWRPRFCGTRFSSKSAFDDFELVSFCPNKTSFFSNKGFGLKSFLLNKIQQGFMIMALSIGDVGLDCHITDLIKSRLGQGV